jgi:hypothetical protein
MTPLRWLAFALPLLPACCLAAGPDDAVARLLDRVVRQEKEFLRQLQPTEPLLEIYIQEIADSGHAGIPPDRDHYFLGRLRLAGGVEYTSLIARSQARQKSRWLFFKKQAMVFMPTGFAQMIFLDAQGFSRANYLFEYVRREFLGEIRCLVFDVRPADPKSTGRFIGRLWVEERDYHIVRFNGAYSNSTASRLYFHFDSWRVHAGGDRWVPALIYVEESSLREQNAPVPRFRAQTRLWGFRPAVTNRLDELTSILVEAESGVRDSDAATDISPLSSQRLWERQAEANVIDRLEKGGLLAPRGEVDAVLDTVANNLVVTNNLAAMPRCRVLLTTPIESFSVGETIVMSRGLIDVLPDEASLAMVLAGELAHIALGHRTNTQFAFNDETMLDDGQLIEAFRFSRSPEEIEAASAKAVELLRNSPYQENLSNAGLFLKALSGRALEFPNLIRANLGNQLVSGGGLLRMTELASAAPALESERLDQIAALPLGSRVKLDPWTNRITLMKAESVLLKSARDKLPFEVTPVAIHLTRRIGAEEEKQSGVASAAR